MISAFGVYLLLLNVGLQTIQGRSRQEVNPTTESTQDAHSSSREQQKRPYGAHQAIKHPHNVRHPELSLRLLPNMFIPIQVPAIPYHPYLPYPYNLPPFSAFDEEGDSNIVNNSNGSSRSASRGRPLFPHIPGPFPHHGWGRPSWTAPQRGDIYKKYLGDGERMRKVLDDLDGEEIISGKLRPCGGECLTDEFLCVGSCSCIPNDFRCDGKADCSGSQDELECGEVELDADLPCLKEKNDYRCPRSGKCIRTFWLCDGDDDCGDYSDETHCNGKNCTETEFECNNGLCIDRSWVCDGDNDCRDNSDEINCTNRVSCSDTEFRCGDGNCIAQLWKCDNDPDCSDGSDELLQLCPQEPRVCNDAEFECMTSLCIRLEFQCDGDDDCGDWSDETNCPTEQATCGPAEFSCQSGRCIAERWHCDEEMDCEDGDDEFNCTHVKPKACSHDEFPCDNGTCIPKTWICDSVVDCIHGEDERDCLPSCDESQFNCVEHRSNASTTPLPLLPMAHINCINKKHVCDGKRDCPGGEDEHDCPVSYPCEKGSKCQHICIKLASGQNACSCSLGFTLEDDGYRCRDVDECQFESEPVCSHLCANNIGSFTCSCMKGYVLRPDGRSCKALGEPPSLIFANRVDIRQLSLNSRKYTAILKGLENAIALDYHFQKKLIFWSDVSKDVIRRATLKGDGKKVIAKWGLHSPSGVAVDWIHDLLFWTDSGTRRVEVATLEGQYRYVLAAQDLDKPRAIVTYPERGLVFWTDWGPHPKIERSNMDGSNRTVIVKESLMWPNGLTIDYPMGKIYWADAKHHVIESSNMDGSDRKKVISKGLPHPFAVTLFEDALFWTDWHTKSIATASKDSGVGYRVLHSGLHFPMDIHSFHSQRQPNQTNHCLPNNGMCTHLCLPTQSSYRCVCPIGLEIQSNRRSCEPSERMLVFACKKDIRLQQISRVRDVGNVDMVIPLDGISSAVSIVVDSEKDAIFWTDVDRRTISKSRINGSDQQILFTSNLLSPSSLALDWFTKKLYWLDWETKIIEVSNLNGSMRGHVVWEGLKKPKSIALNPLVGYMYWTDWGYPPTISRAGMDGSDKSVLISSTEHLNKPMGLTVDFEANLIFWTDRGLKSIMCANIDGSSPRALPISGVQIEYPMSIVVLENELYWSDHDLQTIHKAHKLTGMNVQTLRTDVSGLTGLSLYERHRRTAITSPCQHNNGHCSHFCLLSPIHPGYTCACPVGIVLLEDGRTCAPGPRNYLIFAHLADIRQISLDIPHVTATVLPLPPMRHTVSVDVDMKTGMIYWFDKNEQVISRADSDGDNYSNIVVEGLTDVNTIAVDSTGRKIYWTDQGRYSIEVAELDGTNRAVLVSTGLDKSDRPRSIALHYHHGIMFWSDCGDKPKIEKASMDGKNRKAIVTDNVSWPNGLSIDRPAGRLYWNDAKLNTIESSDLKGKDRRIILKHVPKPYGLVIVGSHIYWTDWNTSGIHRAEKTSGANSQMIITNISVPMDIRSVQVENVAENACGNNNGGCSHLCLRTPDKFSCACPSGIVIQADGKTCPHTPNAFLLFATRRSIMQISLDVPQYWAVALPIPEVHMVVAIDFHWAKQTIYYSDGHLHSIRSVNMRNFSQTQTIVHRNLSIPDSLAVDWLADNIYWTDNNRKVLEVARLDGSCRKVIIEDNLTQPRSVAVFPRRGFLFWADWSTESSKIERSMMDGSSRKVIISSELVFPNGLTIDYSAKKLYWVDATKSVIETSDLTGRGRVVLIPYATAIWSATQYGQHIFWTSLVTKTIERAEKATGRDNVTVHSNLEGVMEIRSVGANKQTGSSPCQINNGGCSHLCLLREKSYLCACPDEPDSNPCRVLEIKKKKEEKEEEDLTPLEEMNGIGGSRSDLDMWHGSDDVPVVESPSSSSLPEHVMSPMTLILLLSCLFCMVVILVSGAVALRYRQRKEPTNLFYSGGPNVLAFSNPNYVTNHESVSDKKSSLWKKLKYDKSQERVYGVADEKPEGVSLMAAPPLSPPPTPPTRFDSMNLAIA